MEHHSILADLSGVQLGELSVLFAFLLICGKGIYNIWFHPLAKFPGPKSRAVSNVLYGWSMLGGKSYLDVQKLHEKYGPVVRVAPNDLSFASSESYQDIYGHANKDRKPLMKTNFYKPKDLEGSIVTEQNPLKHREMRKSLAHAFSAKSLRDQTDLVLKYVDIFMNQVTRLGGADEGIDVTAWYNWLTFDIIGDLAFGESFGSCENAQADPWVDFVCDATGMGLLNDILKRLPWASAVIPHLLPNDIKGKRKAHIARTRQKVEKRLAMKDMDRADFFSHLLSDKNPHVSEGFLISQANTLIVAGSETTATTLAGMTYHLTQNPSQLKRLQQEVRAAFSDPSDITADAAASLPYLHGVIEESLRIFPPVSFGLPRYSSGGHITGTPHAIPAGTVVSTHPYTITHSEEYYHDPNKFHPERWLTKEHPLYDSAFADDKKDAMKPFSLGPRVCIGINLAYVELRIIIARLAWEFDWEAVGPKVDWDGESYITPLWKKPQLPIRFTPRTV